MNRALLISLLFSVAFLSVGRTQEINRLVPWSNAPDQAVMGMSARDLKAMLPTLSPLLGMPDEVDPNSSDIKDGMYSPGSNDKDYSETVAYGIGGSRVTQFYWSSNKTASLADVMSLRKKLYEMHGEPRAGFKARVTKDGIAKIITEVYTVADSELVISLSSALGSTEVAVLDTSDPNVDLDELYFSFEKQRERLRSDLLRLTKNTPKDELAADIRDVLNEAISAGTEEKPEADTNDETGSDETPDVEDPGAVKIDGDRIHDAPEQGSWWRSGYAVLALISGFIILCVLLVVQKLRRKRG
jgi:hypothetical protein